MIVVGCSGPRFRDSRTSSGNFCILVRLSALHPDTVAHPLLELLHLIGNQIKVSETPMDRYEAPPMLGQHTDQVLRNTFWMCDQEIGVLRAAGAI